MLGGVWQQLDAGLWNEQLRYDNLLVVEVHERITLPKVADVIRVHTARVSVLGTAPAAVRLGHQTEKLPMERQLQIPGRHPEVYQPQPVSGLRKVPGCSLAYS